MSNNEITTTKRASNSHNTGARVTSISLTRQKQWKDIIHALTRSDTICVVHDADPDGVTSAVILSETIRRVRGKAPELFIYRETDDHTLTKEQIATIQQQHCTHVFTCDLAVDRNPETVKLVSKNAKLIILDHHSMTEDITTNQILLLKPQILWPKKNPAAYATAKIAYDLGSTVTNLEDLNWIAAAGIIGDSGTPSWRTFLATTFKRHKITLQQDWFATAIGKVASIISNAQSYDPATTPECRAELLNAKGPQNFITSQVARYDKLVTQELNKLILNFKKNAEKYTSPHGIIRWYEILPKYHIKGPLSTILGHKYPYETIFVIDLRSEHVSISGRRGDYNVPINKVLEEAIIGIPNAKAGGHIPAAGAHLDKKYYSLFKKKVIDLLQKRNKEE